MFNAWIDLSYSKSSGRCQRSYKCAHTQTQTQTRVHSRTVSTAVVDFLDPHLDFWVEWLCVSKAGLLAPYYNQDSVKRQIWQLTAGAELTEKKKNRAASASAVGKYGAGSSSSSNLKRRRRRWQIIHLKASFLSVHSLFSLFCCERKWMKSKKGKWLWTIIR